VYAVTTAPAGRAAAKTRSPEEIREAIEAGVRIIGENYVQEAESVYRVIGDKAEWHLIGCLQKNKVKKAVRLFDMIETVDSLEIAGEIDKKCAQIGKTMPVLIEINIAKEEQKHGVNPQDVKSIIASLLKFKNIKITGLMTMGPLVEDFESLRPFFKEAKNIFEEMKTCYKNEISLKYLSMVMSDSYHIAIEEGANMVRIGTAIFGERR